MICSFLSAYNLTNVRYPSVCQSQKRLRVCTFVERKSETFFLSYLLIYSQLPYNRRVVTHCRIVQNYANLSRREFDDLLKQSQLRICLVGMSNCGKTLRSLQLAQQFGFERFCVDDKIEQQISNVLQVQGYSSGIEGVAKWMGYPFEERFYRNQELYLKYENQLTYEATQIARETRRSFVLDTTGSVIYLEKKTQDFIDDTFLVVHLEAPEDMLQEMIQLYFEAPKPVIWGDSFQPLPNEDGISALKRCYPQLLRFRLKRYQQFAHCSVPASVSMNSAFDIDQFIEKIRECLPK
ncbi:uncharacterized protein Gasu_38570 [Galdieria sulphuraria]|uniref:Shikimate kinase n=1 Tax=Galdieria sulphuraria TaxID=130081 RepID=M2XYS1_GALSU|nr:uncharacterized protein Gasu_38570 [Galdieria sulphuraria]EME28649.1 hypothetical protein Gasu_38570 [Galdieria sulphuraria]|eukprot:XP_005705169.1 hypothetical protein Gasu_38570 [Galdieria sulphuraria]